MKRLLSILTIIAAFPLAAFSQSADALLESVAAKFRAAKSVSANFSIASANENVAGRIVLAGEKFHISSPTMSIWYDGQTQWSLSPSAGECNISEPSPEELQQVNPFAIINSFRRAYTSRLLSAPAGSKKIRLTARAANAEIKEATITLNASTLYPTEIVLVPRSGQRTVIKVSNLSTGTNLPISTFRFNKSAFPGVEIVDLR